MIRILWLLLCLCWTAAVRAESDESAIRQLIETQRTAWNRGDLDGYMAGYWKSERLRFASGSEITYGWQETLDRYRRRYTDKVAMGRLDFEILDVQVNGSTASVFGRWKLMRDQDQKPPQGLFTLLLARRPEGWRIIADHTS